MTYSTMPKNDDITILGDTSEVTKSDWNDFWEEDGISLTGNPYYSPDSIDEVSSYHSLPTKFVDNIQKGLLWML